MNIIGKFVGRNGCLFHKSFEELPQQASSRWRFGPRVGSVGASPPESSPEILETLTLNPQTSCVLSPHKIKPPN